MMRSKGLTRCSTRVWLLVLSVIVVCDCLLPADAVGQEGGGSVVEVLTAILGVDQSDVVVGSIPEGSAELFLVPPRSRVVGTLLSENGHSSIVETELDRSEVEKWLDGAYGAAGWEVIDHHGPRGGFQRASEGRASRYCRERSNVHVAMVTGGESLLLRYHVHEGFEVSCEQMRREYDSAPARNFEFPALVSPEGADQRGGLSCGGPNEQAIGTGLVTELSATEVADHYGQQLTSAGWLPLASCWDGPVAVQLWKIEGSQDPLQGLLLVTERGVQKDVLLNVAWQVPE